MEGLTRRSVFGAAAGAAVAAVAPSLPAATTVVAASGATAIKSAQWREVCLLTYRVVKDYRPPSETFRQRQANREHKLQRIVAIDTDLAALKAPSLAWKALVQMNRDLARAGA